MTNYCVEVLDAYIYMEAKGKKGRNNVVSLLRRSLEKKCISTEAANKGPRNALLWYLIIAVDKIKITCWRLQQLEQSQFVQKLFFFDLREGLLN